MKRHRIRTEPYEVPFLMYENSIPTPVLESSMNPIVYLLCGLPGSGKTTYATKLEEEGAVRLTLDEELFKLHGRELPEGTYPEAEKETKELLTNRLIEYLKEGKSVVLDWGFWKKEERDRIKILVLEHGGEPRLLHFKVDMNEQLNRTQGRDLSKNHQMDAAMLAEFSKRFEEPEGEDQIIM
jgi:predicted kinase